MTYLPCAYDPIHFTPSPIPFWERTYDVCMLGVMYPQRIQLVNALRNAGLKVFAGTGLIYEAYRDAYHNARISLCCSSNGDLAQRVFETAAMGCAILTDPLADLNHEDTNAQLGLIGYAVYSNPEMCVAQARELLSKEPAPQINVGNHGGIMQLAGGAGMGEFAASAMQQSVVGHHAWDMRCKVILDWYAREYATT